MIPMYDLMHSVYGKKDTREYIYNDEQEKIWRGDDYPKWNEKSEIRSKYYFHYIPYNLESFYRILEFFKQNYPQFNNFIDVGCGIGDKLLIAKNLFNYNVTGIEYSSYTYKIAQEVGDKYDFNVVNIDAFDFDFSPFNLIYMYSPIRDNELMNKLHDKVLCELNKGIFIDVGKCVCHRLDIKKDNVEPIGGVEFILKTNEDMFLKYIYLYLKDNKC